MHAVLHAAARRKLYGGFDRLSLHFLHHFFFNRSYMMKSRFIVCSLFFALTAGLLQPASADNCLSCGSSNASTALSDASGLVLVGSLSAVAASGQIVVDSVTAVADGLIVVVKNLSSGASATIQLSGKAVQGMAIAAGTVINASVMTTGYLLVASGKALAFIPNETGLALLHHSKVE
jgi:hypothetical protein